MHSRFFYLFVMVALAASPAFAGDDGASASPSTAPIAKKYDKSVEVEPPPEESRIQVPDTPHQDHLGEKPPATNAASGALSVTLTPSPDLTKGVEATFSLSLNDKDNHPLADADLEEVHTQKMHLLIVDEALADYQHVHPTPSGKGWSFSFTPKTAHDYMMWVDVKPKAGNPQLLPVPMKGKEACKDPCVNKTEALTADFDGGKASLHFDAAPAVGVPATAHLDLTDKNGAPLKDLEPVMGAYAHIAAFSGDFSSVAHVHPEGAEPKDDKDRGAAPLTFMIHPEKPGVMKLFVQIRRGGADVFLPFTATIAAPAAPAKP